MLGRKIHGYEVYLNICQIYVCMVKPMRQKWENFGKSLLLQPLKMSNIPYNIIKTAYAKLDLADINSSKEEVQSLALWISVPNISFGRFLVPFHPLGEPFHWYNVRYVKSTNSWACAGLWGRSKILHPVAAVLQKLTESTLLWACSASSVAKCSAFLRWLISSRAEHHWPLLS